jgi:hypothetical protein
VVGEAARDESPTASEAAKTEHRLERWLGEEGGRHNVAQGRVDPYFSHLGDAMFKQTHDGPAWDAPKNVAGAYVRKWGMGVGNYLKQWLANADEYGRTGTIGGAKDSGNFKLSPREVLDASRQDLGLYVEVEVKQRGNGALMAVSIVHTSGRPSFDKFVLAQVPLAVQRLEPPPAQGFGIHAEGLTSIWGFSGRLSYSHVRQGYDPKHDWGYGVYHYAMAILGGELDAPFYRPHQVEELDYGHPHLECDVRLLSVY